MPTAKNFFTETESAQIIAAIKEAELNTSGEIRVHLEDHAKPDAMERAKKLFTKLGMEKTEQRNGVLIYLAVKDHKFAIIGDKGINDVVPVNFWDSVRDSMQTNFKQTLFLEGLCEGIQKAGEQLKQYFPYERGDVNELDDDISYQ